MTILAGIALNCLAQPVQTAADSTKEVFFGIIEKELPAMSLIPADSAILLTNHLISIMENGADSARLAGLIFNYFSNCPVMGSEAVAVHIADNFFLNGKLKWPDSDTYPELFAFAEFNRNSLLGMDAPPLVLNDIDGYIVDIRAVRSPLKVLYFYEDGCASCARETPLLVSLLNSYEGSSDIAFFAIYTQSDRDQWENYVAGNFEAIDNPHVTVYNLWDPGLESGFQMNYGVLSTPIMLMLDSENTIIGRRLESRSLEQLIGVRDNYRAALRDLFDKVTDGLGANETSAMQLTAALFERSDGNIAMFKNTLYEIFKYYRSIPLRQAQAGAEKIAADFILGVNGPWADETLEEIRWEIAKMHQNDPGSIAVDEKLYNKKGARKKMLAGRSPYTVLFFNIARCNDCRQYTNDLVEASPLLKSKKAKVVSVYLSADRNLWLENIKAHKSWTHLTDEGPASRLRDDYDLAVVPRIYLLDKNKKVIAKDITVRELCDILENDEK